MTPPPHIRTRIGLPAIRSGKDSQTRQSLAGHNVPEQAQQNHAEHNFDHGAGAARIEHEEADSARADDDLGSWWSIQTRTRSEGSAARRCRRWLGKTAISATTPHGRASSGPPVPQGGSRSRHRSPHRPPAARCCPPDSPGEFPCRQARRTTARRPSDSERMGEERGQPPPPRPTPR
jgi:hypothetical protein